MKMITLTLAGRHAGDMAVSDPELETVKRVCQALVDGKVLSFSVTKKLPTSPKNRLKNAPYPHPRKN